MESHPEQYSERARLQLRKRILEEHSRAGYDIYELARTLLDLRPGDDVLDIGCGLGEFLIALRKLGHLGRLQGVDKCAEMINEDRMLAEREGCRVEFRIGDASSLDCPSASFNCVTALHVLDGSDYERILSEIGRVLKADGRIVISTNSRLCYPVLGNLKQRAKERFGWFLANEWAEGFDSESAREILRRYFGRVQETRYDDTLQYPDAEVLVDFFRTTRGFWSEGMTEEEWERIVDWARDEAIELIPEHGYAEDRRIFSVFRCSAPLGY
jgi:ubiquinone/menaquinone biosynthesis C-methylase UbiE